MVQLSSFNRELSALAVLGRHPSGGCGIGGFKPLERPSFARTGISSALFQQMVVV
jgi:hypothetical protein